MIGLGALTGQSYLVVGLGKSGQSAVRALQAANIPVTAWDDNPTARATVGNAALTSPDDIEWDTLTGVIWSPGIPHTLPHPHPIADAARAHNVPLVCDVNLLARAKPDATFIGITGTNGKSTTTSLIAHILKESGYTCAVGGNLGTAVLDLDDLGPDGIYVLELSSYQLELVPSLRCNVAVHLNISPDHIDRHGDLNGYIAAKMRLFAACKPEGVAIIGHDDAKSVAMAEKIADMRTWSVVPISTTTCLPDGVCLRGTRLIDNTGCRQQDILDMRDAPVLTGAHNAQNAAAAYAAVRAVGLSLKEAVAGIRSFPGLAHRQERVAEHNNVLYINDSKATNADATEQALSAYDTIFWIAGGQAKAGGITPLRKYFDRITKTYLIGDAAKAFAETLADAPYDMSGTLETAIKRAQKDAEAYAAQHPGSRPVVMLSPACASWDQFASFEARGDAFRDLVLSLTRPTTKQTEDSECPA